MASAAVHIKAVILLLFVAPTGREDVVFGPCFVVWFFVYFSSLATIIGPRREKTCLRDFRQSEFQTSLLSYRDYLEN